MRSLLADAALRLASVALVVAFSACGPNTDVDGGFPRRDGGARLDAGNTDAGGQVDAGSSDGGNPRDAGENDGGVFDAGWDAGSDAGVPDSGNIDAGELDAGNSDAGLTDAGSTDAGSSDDAGQVGDSGVDDAGASDAGSPDAGSVADAGICPPGFPTTPPPQTIIDCSIDAGVLHPLASYAGDGGPGITGFEVCIPWNVGQNTWGRRLCRTVGTAACLQGPNITLGGRNYVGDFDGDGREEFVEAVDAGNGAWELIPYAYSDGGLAARSGPRLFLPFVLDWDFAYLFVDAGAYVVSESDDLGNTRIDDAGYYAHVWARSDGGWAGNPARWPIPGDGYSLLRSTLVDFDRDGTVDVVRKTDGSELLPDGGRYFKVFRNLGDGFAQTADLVGLPGGWDFVASDYILVDLDGDGFIDVLPILYYAAWMHPTEVCGGQPALVFFRGNAGGFEPAIRYWALPNVENPYTLVYAGSNVLFDLNGDGLPDLVRRHQGSSELAVCPGGSSRYVIHFNTGAGFTSEAFELPVQVETLVPGGYWAPMPSSFLDYDGDGVLDSMLSSVYGQSLCRGIPP